MNTLTVEGWCKGSGERKSTPIRAFHFYVSEAEHLRLERAEDELQRSGAADIMVDADLSTLQLQTPPECGRLVDGQWRVYRGGEDLRGQFHLVGHRASDGSLVYSNAIMVDQLG